MSGNSYFHDVAEYEKISPKESINNDNDSGPGCGHDSSSGSGSGSGIGSGSGSSSGYQIRILAVHLTIETCLFNDSYSQLMINCQS